MNALPVRIREITLSFCVRIIRGSPSLQNILALWYCET